MSMESMVSTDAFLAECQPSKELLERLASGEFHVISFETPESTAHITTKRLIVTEVGYNEINKSIPFSFVSQWSITKLKKVTKNDYGPYKLQLYAKSGIYEIDLSEAIDVHKLDRIIASVVFG